MLLDSVDPRLRRFLIDLPVHTYPNVKILVPMTYVVDFPGEDELDSIVRCDALVGSEHELLALTRCDSQANAITFLQERMRVSNLRCAAVTLGARGALAFDAKRLFEIPAIEVDVIDTTGAGDAFAGAFAVGLASRLDLLDALVLANCVAGLSVRRLGAQTALPRPDEVETALSDLSRSSALMIFQAYGVVDLGTQCALEASRATAFSYCPSAQAACPRTSGSS